MNLPVSFIERIKVTLGDEAEAFFEALAATAPVSRRWNPVKKQPVFSQPIGWCDMAEYLSERPIFTLDPHLHAGAYYVQEASSMMIDFALRSVFQKKDKPLKILDLCAAPGGKSTLLANFLGGEGLLVSNEVIKTRVTILKENLIKWGVTNIAITNHEAEDFAALEGFFDVVVVDAPCSGEGLFRKDANAAEEWSLDNVALCSARQKKILANIEKTLAANGVLLYSTCTYNAQENIENVAWLMQNAGYEAITITDLSQFGAVTITKDDATGYQCYPHKVKGEGFFFALLRKQNEPLEKAFLPKKFKNLEKISKQQNDILKPFFSKNVDIECFMKKNGVIVALPSAMLDDAMLLENSLQRIGVGVEVGEIKGKDFVPSQALALSRWVAEDFAHVELSLEQALQYLRREPFSLDEQAQKGWSLMRYEGLNLGWAKLLPNRLNNYYPQEWRIRMR
jgi:16S rRNA C967 or C1407 C5-methylase (RsmB/RsmF family)/NOL1/NOP2/fmu family ribosome biogenesis protein